MKEMVASAYEPERAERARQVEALLQDLIDLHGSWNDYLEDKWQSDDLDFTCFFEREQQQSQNALSGPTASRIPMSGDGAGDMLQLADRPWSLGSPGAKQL